MPLTFHPHPGIRPRRSNQLCTIVPLSTTAPNPVEPFHHRMDPSSLPGRIYVADPVTADDLEAIRRGVMIGPRGG